MREHYPYTILTYYITDILPFLVMRTLVYTP